MSSSNSSSHISPSSNVEGTTSHPSPHSTLLQNNNVNNINNNSISNSPTASTSRLNSNSSSDIEISGTNDIDNSGEEEPRGVVAGRSLDAGDNSSAVVEGSGNSHDGNAIGDQLVEDNIQGHVNSSDINPNNSTTEESSDDTNTTNITVSDDQDQGSVDTVPENQNQTSISKVIELNSTQSTSVATSFTSSNNLDKDSELNSVTSATPHTSSQEQIGGSSTSSLPNNTVTQIANLSTDKDELSVTTIRINNEQQLPLNTTQVPKTVVDNNLNQSITHITNTSQTRIVSIEDVENVSIGDGSGEGSGDSFSDSRQLFSKEEVERRLFDMRLICFCLPSFFLYFVCIEVTT